MQEMFSKLSSYAALLGVIGAIGGGFMAWGEFNNRIAQLENQEFIVNETVDLSGIIKELEALKGDIKINGAAIEYVDAQVEELLWQVCKRIKLLELWRENKLLDLQKKQLAINKLDKELEEIQLKV
jgi:hypothetical protein